MNNTARTALEALKSEIYRNEHSVQFDELFEAPAGEWHFAVRYFGDWQNPDDARDEEDYDWQVPTRTTRARLDALCASYSKRFGITVRWQNEGEKCWVSFTATVK